MSTYSAETYLAKPADNSQAWGAEIRNNFDYLSRMLAAQKTFRVSPSFTTALLGNASATDRRFFDTIQGAIDAAEASGYTAKQVIEVEQGDYAENLVHTKSIRINGVRSPFYEAQGGGRSISLRGSSAVQEPLVTINRADSQDISVIYSNMVFENLYDQAATTIAKPYFLEANAPSIYGSYAGWIGFQDCQLRGQTWGSQNDWAFGMRVRGWVNLQMNRVQIMGGSHGGGNGLAGIERLIHIEGDNAASKKSLLHLRDVDFESTYLGAGTPCFVYGDEGVDGSARGCSLNSGSIAALIDGGVGTNVIDGLMTGDFNSFPKCNSVGASRINF
jgi:hypothetical protein